MQRLLNRARQLATRAAFQIANPAARPMLSVPEHLISRPKYQAIDAHAHLRGVFSAGWAKRSAAELEKLLDTSGLERIVDLDGETGDALEQ